MRDDLYFDLDDVPELDDLQTVWGTLTLFYCYKFGSSEFDDKE